jgi:hypothetical protein
VSNSDSEENKNRNLKQILFKDGIRYSINIAFQSFSRLKFDLLALTKNDYARRKKNEEELTKEQTYELEISAISNAWQIIDSTNRLRELLRLAPNIKKKDTEYQLFLRKSDDIKHLRNNIQHLNSQIEAYIKNNIPVWGTLNWIGKVDNGEECLIFSLVPGEIFPRTTSFLNPVGKKITLPIGLITLISDKTVCISEIVENDLARIKIWLEKNQAIDFSHNGQSLFISAECSPK